jgi:D-ribose pyranase
MKKIGIINAPLASIIASLGHTDTLVVCDAGLPIPATTQRIDLALTRGIPGFVATLQVVLSELYVERALVAAEMLQVSPNLYAEVKSLLGATPLETILHVEFKKQTGASRAVVRTGEFTPYANIILVTGAWGFAL